MLNVENKERCSFVEPGRRTIFNEQKDRYSSFRVVSQEETVIPNHYSIQNVEKAITDPGEQSEILYMIRNELIKLLGTRRVRVKVPKDEERMIRCQVNGFVTDVLFQDESVEASIKCPNAPDDPYVPREGDIAYDFYYADGTFWLLAEKYCRYSSSKGLDYSISKLCVYICKNLYNKALSMGLLEKEKTD